MKDRTGIKSETSLPTEVDFDPYGGDLDARFAWKNFGGLTLEEATKKFREIPEIYQEDFMFMGGKAFAFYFPVLEAYLRDVPEEYEGDDRQSWILAHCLRQQFEAKTAHHVLHLVQRVFALSTFVQQNIHRFGDSTEEQRRIADAWMELDTRLRALKT